VTAAGVGALRKGVPDIRVDWDGYDSEVAAWVFTSGGMLAVRTRGESRTIDGIDALPAEGFEIEVVELGGAAGLRDADLTIVRGLKRLRVLDLSRTPVGDAGLEHIRGLHNLQTVYLKNTRVTDAGLPHLLALVDLTHVDLNGPQITDKGLETLKDLKHLTTLSLSECRVTDQGLAQLRGHPELRRLMLEGTQVTDAAIDVLLTLAKLEEVNLIDTRVTAEGVARLKEALPGRKVDWIPKWTPTPEQQAFIEAVMLLPAEEQVAAFTQKLKAVNPGYDVSFEHIVAEGKVVRVSLKGNTQTVRAIWPIAALTGLTELALGEAPVADLSPVTRLTELRFLSCYRTAVTDIEPVSALRNLEVLDCRETLVRDLSPLAGLPLKELRTFAVSPYNEQFRHLAGTCPQLETINGLPIAEFLARRDEVEQLRKLLPAYPAERQLELVVERLKAFNPGWNGELERNDNHPEIVDGKVVRFALAAPHRASDLSPLRALRHLKRLFCNGNQELADLSPLSGMELIDLYCQASGIADLAPLRGMPLAALVCEDNPVTDLSPLAGAPLSRLECSRTRVVDLTPLVNCPLEFLSFSGTRVAELSALERAPLKFLWCDATRVSDLSALRGAPLEELVCNGTTISDLSPLVGMPLKRLKIASTRVTDLSPLAELPLEELVCAGTQVADLSSLAGLKLHVLECQSTPVSDLSPLADLPLVDLNCSFTSVSDLTPLARLKLTRLWLMGTQVNDLTPLKGMPLNALDLASAPVTDLAPLAGLPLGYVNCSGTPVSDLAPLRKTPVTTLLLNGSRVADLSPLQGLPLTHLNCDETSVSDYSPLSGMPLTELGMTPRIFHQADEDLLRSFMSLTKVNYVPMDEFWQSVTRRRQETEEFVAAAKDLGPQEQALAVIEQLRKVHAGAPEGWLAASSRVIDGDSVELSIQVNQGNLIDLRPLRALSRLKVLRVSGYLPLLRDLSPLNSLPLEELEVTDPVLGPLSLQANLPVLRAMHSLKSINGRPAAEYLRLLAEPDRVVAESVLSRSGQVTITGNVIVTSTELPAAPFRVAEVNYSETTVTDDDLAELEYLPGLRTLRISGTNIGDRGFATICKLPSLQHFVAHSVPVTDEGLKQVADLKGLRILHLSSSRLTDRSLSVIAALRNLDYLYVGSVQFTDDGLRALTNLETLTSFGVWSEGFTDEGVGRVLDRLNPERLSELQLGAPGITDRTLQRLTRFTQVRGLDLRGTAVTDAGLLSLHGLHELSAIDLTSTRVTAAGVAELRQALPKCKVVWDGAEAQP
jgi:Leucine-rich repeat (LRR) protein